MLSASHHTAATMKPKFDSLTGFFKALQDPHVTPRQKKAILLHCTKIQRLGLAEIILNVILGNLAVALSDEICDSLEKYRPHLSNIISLGKKITNKVLSRKHRAVVFALQISMTPLNGSELNMNNEGDSSEMDMDVAAAEKDPNTTTSAMSDSHDVAESMQVQS